MFILELSDQAVTHLCVQLYGFPILRQDIKSELADAGFNSTLTCLTNGKPHIQFSSDSELVMFKLKYSEFM